MADSTRKKVVDAILSAVSGVTGVNRATDDPQVWTTISESKKPCVFVNMGAVAAERFAFPHPTSQDMLAEAQIILDGVIQTRTAGSLDSTMDSVIAGTIKAVEALTISGVTIMESVMQSLDYTKDHETNYGIFRGVFRVKYLYNHLAP